MNQVSTQAKVALIGANFFIETNRMEAFLGVYLIEFKTWASINFGYVSALLNIVMLLFQVPAGWLLDNSSYKRAVTATATLVAAVTTAGVVWNSDFWYVMLLKGVEGIAAAIFLPALMSLLLGIVRKENVPNTVAQTETSNKIGSVLFTMSCGFIGYFAYPDVEGVFYLLAGGGILAAAFIMFIPSASIDHNRARNLSEETKDGEEEAKPITYCELMKAPGILIFSAVTFAYHLGNAGVVQLTAQLAALDDKRASLAFASGCLTIFYLVQAPTAYLVGRNAHRFDYKTMLLAAHCILPVRCAVLAALAYNSGADDSDGSDAPNPYAVVSTQVFDGLAAGIYDTMMPLVTHRLSQSTGHFALTFGFFLTCWRIGHGLSVLLGEVILHEYSYGTAFVTLGGIGVVACLALAFFVTVPGEDGGASDDDIVDDDCKTTNELSMDVNPIRI